MHLQAPPFDADQTGARSRAILGRMTQIAASRPIAAHRAFFPAAALYAACALPLSIVAMQGRVALPGLAFPAGHAHEMLFGFALAAVAGNQLGPLPRGILATFLGAWIAARFSFVAVPGSWFAALANATVAGLLAWRLLPRVTAPIRKWRNRALPVAVMALCAAAVAMEASLRLGTPGLSSRMLLAGVLLLALLMAFMGGRIIAPAAAGQAYREGGNLAARVQPRLEAFLIVALGTACAAVLLGAVTLAGALVLASGFAVAVRLARWRPWRLGARRDLLGLAAGYTWLAVGLATLGLALLRGGRPVTAIHVVTIGALGTLTIQVMALTWARLARRDPARLRLPAIGSLLVALATVARVLADADPARRDAWLATAAAAWSGAYALLLLVFARV
jgi:uncharacterized protein involved in response to NO